MVEVLVELRLILAKKSVLFVGLTVHQDAVIYQTSDSLFAFIYISNYSNCCSVFVSE